MNNKLAKRLRKVASKGKTFSYKQLKQLYKTDHKDKILNLLNEYEREIKKLESST